MAAHKVSVQARALLLALIVFNGLIKSSVAFLPKQKSSVAPGNGHLDSLAPNVAPTTMVFSSIAAATTTAFNNNDDYRESESNRALRKEHERQDWIERSVSYYSKVMREERRRNLGQIDVGFDSPEHQEEYVLLAKKHYFAIRKVKDRKFHQAESIYRRIIDELMEDDEDHCDHAKLAVTTLLLALLTKRMGDPKKTRSVFLSFFRIVVLNAEEGKECACSAKVLCAFSLFEMQQGNSLKSLEIARKALEFDSSLEPVLRWKQFREVLERSSRHNHDGLAP